MKLKGRQGLNWKQRSRQVKKLVRTSWDGPDKELERLEVIRQAFRNSTLGWGVSCFSEHPDSVLMWSHYADCHRGICLRYKTSQRLSQVLRVKYEKMRPVLNPVLQDPLEAMYQATLTKADFWAYENEWRAMDTNVGGKVLKLHASVLTGVILGARMTQEAEVEVREWVGRRGSGIELLKAEFDGRDFRLEIVPATNQ